MDAIVNGVNWWGVILSTVVVFVLGSVWYAQSVFGAKWMKGIGTQAVPGRPLGPLLVVQFAASFLLAWGLFVAAASSVALAILIAIAAAGLIKAGGFFSGKSVYAIATESGYALVQGLVIIVIYTLLK